jgi:hypothetical protein
MATHFESVPQKLPPPPFPIYLGVFYGDKGRDKHSDKMPKELLEEISRLLSMLLIFLERDGGRKSVSGLWI